MKRLVARSLLLAVLAVAAPALAQDTTGSTEQQTAQPRRDTRTLEQRRDEDLFRDESGREVPVSQYIPLSDQAIGEMKKELTVALEAQKAAREANDAVRLSCVNDKLTAMKGIIRISDGAMIDLQEALSSNANEKARYEFGKIRVARKRVGQLATELQSCTGAESTYTGEGTTELITDDELLGSDPYYGYDEFFANPEDNIVDGDTTTPGDNEPIDSRPPPSSPFQGAG